MTLASSSECQIVTARLLPGNHGQSFMIAGPFPYLSLSPIFQDNGIGKGKTKRFVLEPSLQGLEGAFVYIPSDAIDALSMSLRARDTSVNSQSFGTRDPEFKTTVRLIDVPTDASYRVRLRIYGYTSSSQSVRVRMYRPDAHPSLPLLDERIIDLRKHESTGIVKVYFPGARPAYAELDPFSAAGLEAVPRARIEIEALGGDPASRIWAFASVTHNATQQVTIVAP